MNVAQFSITLVLLLSACAGGPTAVTATFDVDGETFQVRVTDPRTIAELERLGRGESRASIPNGRLALGTGNEPWSWRLEDVEMAEATVELCDARPSYVEAHLEEFLVIGRYCPWIARLVSLGRR